MPDDDERACPECGHFWEVHSRKDGCLAGWTYADDGTVVGEGCLCPLAHVDRSI